MKKFISLLITLALVLTPVLIPGVAVMSGAAELDWVIWNETVSNEEELANAISGAGANPTIIELTQNIITTKTVNIPANAIIKFKGSDGIFAIDANGGDFTVVEIDKDAIVYIEDIIITGADKTGSGGGLINYGTFIMESGSELYNNKTRYIPTIWLEDGNGAGGVNYGTFIMNGGSINNNYSATVFHGFGDDGGAGLYNKGGTFIMNGGIITENTSYNGNGGGLLSYRGEVILNGGTFSKNNLISGYYGGSIANFGGLMTMEAGVLITETVSDCISVYNGPAINIFGDGWWDYEIIPATFIMNGGSISGNNSTGLYNASVEDWPNEPVRSTFIMNDGLISDNTSHYAGGVRNGGIFTMNGGKITGNIAEFGSGGVETGGIFNMNGGEISKNELNNNGSSGGGVFNAGIMNLNDGKITENKSNYGGGGIGIITPATLNINGGEISNNTAEKNGGGIWAYSDGNMRDFSGTVNVNGGKITGNKALNGNGGGIYSHVFVNGTGYVNIYGGEISDNYAGNNGGGVYTYTDRYYAFYLTWVVHEVKMTGGKIINNTAENNGGGIYNHCEFIIEGDAEISGNKALNGNGGGIYDYYTEETYGTGLLTIKSGKIINNDAALDGGGIYADDYLKLDIYENVIFDNNTANQAHDFGIENKEDYPNIDWANVSILDTHALNNYDINYNLGTPFIPFKVKFMDSENIIAIQKVKPGNSAKAPNVPPKTCYVFEWDKDFSTIENDLIVNIIWTESHNYNPTEYEPTCTEDGYIEYKCEDCEDNYTEPGKPAIGHNWGNWILTTPPTYTSEGVETRVCLNNSEHIQTRSVAQLISIPPSFTEEEENTTTENNSTTESTTSTEPSSSSENISETEENTTATEPISSPTEPTIEFNPEQPSGDPTEKESDEQSGSELEINLPDSYDPYVPPYNPQPEPTISAEAPPETTANIREDIPVTHPTEPNTILFTSPIGDFEIMIYETMPEHALPLSNGWFAVDLGDDLYEIFDENGVPLGFIRLEDNETIESWTDFDNIIPMAEFIAEIKKEIKIISAEPEILKSNPKTGDRILIILVFLTLSVTVILIVREQITNKIKYKKRKDK